MTARTWIPGLLLLGACGPSEGSAPRDFAQEYAQALCDAMSTCECLPRFDSEAACMSEFSSRFQAFLTGPYDFDRSCFDEGLDRRENDPCGSTFSKQDDHCVTFSGRQGEGSPCAPHGGDIPGFGAIDCDDGLNCGGGVCVGHDGGIPTQKNAGDACADIDPFSCNSADLYCSPSDGTCHPRGLAAEPCEAAALLGCEAPLDCLGTDGTATGTCAQQAALGESCDPFDWDACVPSEDPSVSVVCDVTQRTCVVGQPFCSDLNFPPTWWPR